MSCVPCYLPGTPRSLSAITRMSSDEVQMKMSYQCPTSVLLLSDYLQVAPITLLLVTYQHHLCVTNWNVSDQYLTKLVGNEKYAFRPASGLCGRGGHYLNQCWPRSDHTHGITKCKAMYKKQWCSFFSRINRKTFWGGWVVIIGRNYLVFASSLWQTLLHCNVVSHWLGTHTQIDPSTCCLIGLAFTSSPLCATAMWPWNVSTTNGWQFTTSDPPAVE